MASICGNHPVGKAIMCKEVVFCPACQGTPISRKYFQSFMDLVEQCIFEKNEEGEKVFTNLAEGPGDMIAGFLEQAKDKLALTP